MLCLPDFHHYVRCRKMAKAAMMRWWRNLYMMEMLKSTTTTENFNLQRRRHGSVVSESNSLSASLEFKSHWHSWAVENGFPLVRRGSTTVVWAGMFSCKAFWRLRMFFIWKVCLHCPEGEAEVASQEGYCITVGFWKQS